MKKAILTSGNGTYLTHGAGNKRGRLNMLNRRKRKELAREAGIPFEPQYSSGKRRMPHTYEKNSEGKLVLVEGEIVTVGGEPKSYEEMFGIGYERFNNKFVTIKEVESKE